MAQSLWRDGDLDLRNNYANEHWREYTPGPVTPHYGAPRRDGRPFPAHSPGLPLILAPAYALGGRAACVALLVLMGVGRRCRLGISPAPDPAPRGRVSGLLATVGPPVFFYSFHVYTEVPSALRCAGALRLLLASRDPGRRRRAALLAATLPWLHVKMVPAAAALGVVGVSA